MAEVDESSLHGPPSTTDELSLGCYLGHPETLTAGFKGSCRHGTFGGKLRKGRGCVCMSVCVDPEPKMMRRWKHDPQILLCVSLCHFADQALNIDLSVNEELNMDLGLKGGRVKLLYHRNVESFKLYYSKRRFLSIPYFPRGAWVYPFAFIFAAELSTLSSGPQSRQGTSGRNFGDFGRFPSDEKGHFGPSAVRNPSGPTGFEVPGHSKLPLRAVQIQNLAINIPRSCGIWLKFGSFPSEPSQNSVRTLCLLILRPQFSVRFPSGGRPKFGDFPSESVRRFLVVAGVLFHRSNLRQRSQTHQLDT